MGAKHSVLVRGLKAAGEDRFLTGGKFGRLFPNLPTATYGTDEAGNLKKLADAMVSELDPPKDSPDDEESGIPAIYTYFGQFIDHDLTFDPNSTFQKKKDPDATINFRTAAFDMDNIYGRGPGDQPYLYDTDGVSFRLGDPITQGNPAGAFDLQRNGAGRALIGDPRNDENAIVSQLQGLVLRFHNRMAAEHDVPFAELQEKVRHRYQYVVLNDFLPRIVSAAVLDSLKVNGVFDKSKLRLFNDLKHPFIPVEFSTAAYRLGHSMIRPGYRLNDTVLLPIFPISADATAGKLPFPEGLTGFRRLISDWALDWGRFIDLDTRDYGVDTGTTTPNDQQQLQNFRRLQFAYRIDTALVEPLINLPASVAGDPPPSLALRNLLRGREFGLPSGQQVAQAIGVTALEDSQILIGQGIKGSLNTLPNITTIAGSVFNGNCPLWTYILAEAMQNQVDVNIPVTDGKVISTPQLGQVGGRIVAETFLALMFADGGSYIAKDAHWAPDGNHGYGLKDFLNYALGKPVSRAPAAAPSVPVMAK
jgi:hypothetical protein